MESDSERETGCSSAVVVQYNEDKENPVTFKRKWGEDKLPIVDWYTYLGVEISKDCSWDAHIAKAVGKGKAHVSKMDPILADSHPATIRGLKHVFW